MITINRAFLLTMAINVITSAATVILQGAVALWNNAPPQIAAPKATALKSVKRGSWLLFAQILLHRFRLLFVDLQ
jgi:hypothetical protein